MPTDLIKPPAEYRIVARDDEAFAVEISIEDTSPTMVTPFATEAAADAWIEGHKARVLAPPARRYGRQSMAGKRTPPPEPEAT
jgi:hypothetical protein